MRREALLVQNMRRLITDIRPTDALIAVAIYLSPERSNHAWAGGLLILWIGLQLSEKIINGRASTNWREECLAPTLLLSLATFQARTIIRMDDHPGASYYIIIASTIFAGASFSRRRWTALIRWLSLSASAISLYIYSYAYKVQGIDDFRNWIDAANQQYFNLGLGRINALASFLAILAITSFYAMRQEPYKILRPIHGITAIAIYILCLETDSRVAAGAPLLAATISFAYHSKGYKFIRNKIPKKLIKTAAIVTTGLIIWSTAIRSELAVGMDSDITRLGIWKCWIDNSIFAGNGKIIHGIGYNLEGIVSACKNQSADGSLVQILGQHGIIGLLSLILMLVIAARSIAEKRNRYCINAQNSHTNLIAAEAGAGMAFTVLLCNLVTPAYMGSFTGAALTGLALSAAIASGIEIDEAQKKTP